MFENLLPIGSVVTLRGGFKKLMITGVKIAKEDNPEKFYDYIGVFYPEGFVGAESNFLFDHNDINDIVFRGYENPERKSFIEFMEESYENQIDSEENV